MPKKFFVKATAIFICVGFLMLAVPGLNSAEKKASKTNVPVLLKEFGLFPFSFFPSISVIFDTGSKETVEKSVIDSSTSTKAKPTGDLVIGRPSKGD
ncbi:MAG: hypothetical protein WCC06_03400 [Candidatus Aminicenantales bacterium]